MIKEAMTEGSSEIKEHPFTTGRVLKEVTREPIITLPRGVNDQRSRIVKLVPLENPQPNQDPFVAVDLRTKRPVELQQRERVLAYRELHLEPPSNLVHSLTVHQKIRERKKKRVIPQDQSLIETF